MFESCYVFVSLESLDRVRPPFPFLLLPYFSYILSHSPCDTSLSKSPTTIVDLTHPTPIRNLIINPLLAC